MASLDQFNALPMKQKVGIIAGAGALVAAVFAYMIYDSLGKLGPDPDNLFGFMVRDTGTGIWNDINSINKQIKDFEAKAKQLPAKEAELAQLNKEIKIAREYLPESREKSKIAKELGVFARQVVLDNQGQIKMTRLSISEQAKRETSRRRRKSKGAAEAQSVTFTCNFLTDIDGLIAFINKVELSTRFMTVDGISLTPGDVTAELEESDPREVRELHKAEVIINTWVLPEPE